MDVWNAARERQIAVTKRRELRSRKHLTGLRIHPHTTIAFVYRQLPQDQLEVVES